jgi:UDP-arabinose 4-epimerase
MTNILVTGGAGYIGSHTCKLLKQKGYTPVTLDNLSRGHLHNVRWGPFVEGDIRDAELLEHLFRKYSPAGVIHFAALAYVGESVLEPLHYYQNNVEGTLILLETMRRHACKRIIFSSSCAVYGSPDSLPIHEDQPTAPINPYGRSKLFVENILRDCHRAYGLEYVALRYFNAAGADPEGELGEEHSPETHLLPLAIFAAIRKEGVLSIFGNNYPTSDGTAVRDYVHVNDIAGAHIQAIRYLDEGKSSCCLNLGNGTGYSVQEIINTVEKIGNCRVPVRITARRPGDPAMLIAAANHAREVLGWQPRYNDIESIVSSAWQWHCRPQNDSSR